MSEAKVVLQVVNEKRGGSLPRIRNEANEGEVEGLIPVTYVGAGGRLFIKWVLPSDIPAVAGPTGPTGPAGPVGRRGFASADETLGPGESAFVNVAVPGHEVGDLCGAYKTITTASTFPDVLLIIEATSANTLRVRIWNTGAEEAVLTSGSFTFWLQSSPTVAPEE